MQVNQFERAYRTWEILTGLALQKHPITYGELGKRLGIHHRAVKWPLYIIQDHCLEAELPGLTILVEDQQGVVGQGFTAYSRDRLTEGRREVLAFDWNTVANPFALETTGKSREALVEDILEKPEERPTIYALVKIKSRGAPQRLFRAALLDAYRGTCALSGSTMTEVLEAAHIVPWSELSEGERFNPQNGILLNVLYHRLFDSNVLILDKNRRMQLGPNVNLAELSEFDRSCLEPFIGKRLKPPRHKKFFPGDAFIAWRLENY